MYSLTFVHPKGTSHIQWDLDAEEEDEAYFVNYNGKMAVDFVLKGSPELLTIYHGARRLLELCFLPDRMIYLLRTLDGSKILREFYLEEEQLEEMNAHIVRYV